MIFQPILPWWGITLMLLPAILFIGLGIWSQRRQSGVWFRWIRRSLLVLLILAMAVRPSLPGGSGAAGNALLDVYFLVDTTVSSSAEDYNGNRPRIEGMRHDVKAIAEKLAGARFSIISFDNKVFQVLPLTHDVTTLATGIDTLPVQQPSYADGSSVDAPLEIVTSELQRLEKADPSRGRVVFYLGDGEQTSDQKPASFADIKPLVKGGAVLGYGTAAGGKMADEIGRKYGNRPYLKDQSARTYPTPDAVSKIDEEMLRTIANQAGIQYIHRTQPTSVQEITDTIDIGAVIKASHDASALEDWYWVLTPAALLLLAIDTWAVLRAGRALKVAKKGGKQ